MYETAILMSTFATMFVVIDPIGVSHVFLALTRDIDTDRRNKIAFRACSLALLFFFFFALGGEAGLNFIGISMAAFHVGGGLLLFIIAFQMLFDRQTKPQANRQRLENQNKIESDPSVFPLAIPLLCGPGAVTSIILLTDQNPGVAGFAMVIGVTTLVISMSLVCFRASARIGDFIGETGVEVITRLLGMLLAALSAQFVLDGLQEFGF